MTPVAVVALAAAVLGRPDWGRAMLGELDRIGGRAARWRFAAGCLRALAVSASAMTATALAGGLASLAVVATALARYPGLVTGIGTWLAVGCFVAVVAGYVVATVGLGVRLGASGLLVTAAAAAALIACSWWTVGFAASRSLPAGVPLTLLALGPVAALVLGAGATLRTRSRRSGLECVGLASLLAGFALFLLWGGQTVAFAGRPYDAGMLRDFRTSGAHDLATYAVSDSLGSGMMLLLLVPLVSLVAGLVGVAIVRRRVPAGD